jgi:hypothetical protein
MSALAPKVDISWSVQTWVPQVLLLRPGAIGPMEGARYQGYERRGASSAFQRVIWNIKRQNIFVCFSDVTHVTIHGTPLTCDLRLRCSRRCAR